MVPSSRVSTSTRTSCSSRGELPRTDSTSMASILVCQWTTARVCAMFEQSWEVGISRSWISLAWSLKFRRVKKWLPEPYLWRPRQGQRDSPCWPRSPSSAAGSSLDKTCPPSYDVSGTAEGRCAPCREHGGVLKETEVCRGIFRDTHPRMSLCPGWHTRSNEGFRSGRGHRAQP